MTSNASVPNPFGSIAPNRKIVLLRDICSEKDGIQTGPFGSQLHSSDYVQEGTPLIMVEHLGENIIKSESTPFVSAADAERLRKYTMRRGDIIFSRVGYVDKRALVKDAHDGWLFSGSLLRIRPNFNLVDSTYLSYFFGYPRLKKYMGDVSVGATRPSINTTILKDIPVVLPEMAEQKVIGSVLSELDGKIALNLEISKGLEDLGKAIFKSWFVDFDPVRAKMAGGELAGLDEETASLFPSSLEQSESGYIPSGWQVVKVERLLTRLKVKGLAKSTPLKHTGRTLVLEQGDSVVAGFLDQDADVLASPASPKFIFGDHTCRMRLSTQPFSVLPNTIVLDSTDVNPFWAFQATRGLQSFETYRRHWMEFAQKSVIVPPKQLTEAFGAMVAPLYAQIDSLMLENRKLAAVRDAILPGLISGEIEIPEEMLVS